MAQRISFEERVRIEEMRAAALSVEETARRLGRPRPVGPRRVAVTTRNGDRPMQFLPAMSGGLDSSVAAALLAALGHEVVDITMTL